MKENLFEVLLVYVLTLNTAGFLAMGWDKRKAKRGKYRVPERTLFGIAALGGALGAWIGMRVWRHKTKHRSFTLGIPAWLLVHIAVAVLVYRVWG